MDNNTLDCPIFLHFLNRELRETENVSFTDEQVFLFLTIAILMTNEYLYVGDAIVWECYSVFPKSIDFLRKMEKIGAACFVGTDMDVNSFLIKRRRLYSHDRKRYPVYFNDKMAEPLWGENHKHIDSDTTAFLARKLFDIVNGFDKEKDDYSYTDKEKEIIANRLDYRRREDIAVTYSLFKREKIKNESKLALKRNIIRNYNQRYLEALNGKYLTGINGIQYYDSFQESGCYFDYNLFLFIYKRMGIVNQNNSFSEAIINDVLDLKFSNAKLFSEMLLEIRKIASGLQCIEAHHNNKEFFLYKNLKLFESFNDLNTEEKVYALCKVSQKLCGLNLFFKEGYEEMSSLQRRVLVLAASPLEYKILRATVKELGFVIEDKDSISNEDFPYAECYSSLQSKVFLARTDMGALNASSTIQHLAEELHTNYVIMGGICAGLRPDNQHIGDIIISKQIHDYDLSKVTEDQRIQRGNTLTPNRYLVDKLLLESFESEFVVDSGLIISANTLANSREYIKEILKEYPDAKGYEMEGAGLIHTCQLLMDKWVLVKAICDWGYDKKDADQEMAAKNSYRFILNTIKNRMG